MSEYELVNDQYYGQWINKPDNMGDVGDLREITDELNRILSELNEAREQNAKLREIAERAINLALAYYDGPCERDGAKLRAELNQIKEGVK